MGRLLGNSHLGFFAFFFFVGHLPSSHMHVHVRPAWRGQRREEQGGARRRRREAAVAAPIPEPNKGAHFYILRFEEEAALRQRWRKCLHSVLK